MRVEAIGAPIRYTWPGGSVLLEPGSPIELDDARAQRLMAKVPGRVRVVSSTIQIGTAINWTRGDGSMQIGTVEFLHHDAVGNDWAFVTIEESWVAVNLKFARGVTA